MPQKIKPTPETMRKAMVKGLEIACACISNHAEDIVGDMNLMQALDVTISFDPNETTMIIPNIEIKRRHIGLTREDLDKVYAIYDGRDGEEK